MTDTARRALLGAIIAAPVLGVAAHAAASPVRADLAALDEPGLLDVGSRNADAQFAALCRDALQTSERSTAAGQLYDDASEAAERDTPEYPAGLRYRCRFTHLKGEWAGQVDEWEERCEPDGERASMLWNMAHRRAKAAGVTYTEAEAQLRSEFAAWRAAKHGAEAHYMTRELRAADDAASDAAGDAFRRVLECPARNAEALLIKLHLRANAEIFDFEGAAIAQLIADIQRVGTA
jgi:hypothetical protein